MPSVDSLSVTGFRRAKDLFTEKSDKFETLKGFLSPLNVDSDMDSDIEDGLTASDVEHQKALSAAIEQEADLSKEYQKKKKYSWRPPWNIKRNWRRKKPS